MSVYNNVESRMLSGEFFDYVYGYPSKRKYSAFSDNKKIAALWQSVNSPVDLYIHIPFCKSKCYFCNLCSTSSFNSTDIDDYVSVLTYQLREYAAVLKNKILASIYFGGGTPTVLSETHFSDIFDSIYSNFELLSPDIEICVEGCPSSISTSRKKLDFLAKLGVNRISMGVQSFHDDELIALGRLHSSCEALKAIDEIRNSNIANLNIDLIYGLEGQSNQKWISNLNTLLTFRPEAVTLYPLNIRKSTKLYKDKEGAVDDSRMYGLYDLTNEYMTDNGYSQDTFVLFSSQMDSGFGYKQQQHEFHCYPMLGVGIAARSYLDSLQYRSYDSPNCNVDDIKKYIQIARNTPVFATEGIELSLEDQMNRFFVLRLLDFNFGLSLDEFMERFNKDIRVVFEKELSFLRKYKLLEITSQKIMLTDEGKKRSNMLPLLFC